MSNMRNIEYQIEDDYKNIVYCVHKGDTVDIRLGLAKESHKRKIGKVYKSPRELHVSRKNKKHLHIKSNSYGFNFDIINRTKLFDKVRLTDDNGQYLIPREVIIDKGQFLFFKQQGAEKQIFLSLEIMKDYECESSF